MKRPIKYVVGLDEVGRGALAGPVIVAALALPMFSSPRFLSSPRKRGSSFLSSPRKRGSKSVVIPAQAGIQKIIYTTLDSRLRGNDNKFRDSKKLSPKQREKWFQFIKQQKIPYAVASVSPKIIDKINISQAANLAATRALMKLIKISKLKAHNNCEIFLDGGLFLGKLVIASEKFVIASEAKQSLIKNKRLPRRYTPRNDERYKAQTIVRADEKIPAVALASIVAKVHRDKFMRNCHKKFPRYDFCNNVGYGTSKHIKAIKKFGRSKIHRKSFSF